MARRKETSMTISLLWTSPLFYDLSTYLPLPGLSHSQHTHTPLPFSWFKTVLSLTRYSKFAGRVTIATRFQRAFMQLLSNAQFEELSARDLMLTSALNTDYLLTLPTYVDWKRAYESNAIIFR